MYFCELKLQIKLNMQSLHRYTLLMIQKISNFWKKNEDEAAVVQCPFELEKVLCWFTFYCPYNELVYLQMRSLCIILLMFSVSMASTVYCTCYCRLWHMCIGQGILCNVALCCSNCTWSSWQNLQASRRIVLKSATQMSSLSTSFPCQPSLVALDPGTGSSS